MTFYFPPRPERAILPSMIQSFEDRGWVWQVKKNGTCSTADVDTSGNVDLWTRHKDERHKAWTPTPDAIEFFGQYPGSTFVFELLHSKGGGIRDTIYLFDILKYRDSALTGTTLAERLNLLELLCSPSVPKIGMAETMTGGAKKAFDALVNPLDEGIVMKDPNATLKSCLRDGLNSGWQVKCRKPTKNFGF